MTLHTHTLTSPTEVLRISNSGPLSSGRIVQPSSWWASALQSQNMYTDSVVLQMKYLHPDTIVIPRWAFTHSRSSQRQWPKAAKTLSSLRARLWIARRHGQPLTPLILPNQSYSQALYQPITSITLAFHGTRQYLDISFTFQLMQHNPRQ